MATKDGVQTAFHVLESLQSDYPLMESSQLGDLMAQLRFLRTFYMCGKKWGKDADRCESVLHRIEQIVEEEARKLESPVLKLRDVRVESDLKWLLLDKGVSKFLARIQQSFLQEMEELYLVFLDGSSQSGTSSPEEVNLLVDSLLDNLQDLLQQESYGGAPLDAVQDLEENVRFLKNFLLFAMFGVLESWQMEELLAHFGGLVLHAAYLTFMSRFYYYRKMWCYIYQLIERIQPIEARICDIYARVFQALKLSLPSHRPAPGSHQHLFRDFADSLLTLLSGQLVVGTSSTMNFFSDQMQKLHDKLTFLSSILKETAQDKFDELYDKLHDRIGLVICDVATMICYLFARNDEGALLSTLNHLFLDFEENFKLIKAEMETLTHPLTSASQLQYNVVELIDSVLEKMGLCQVDSVALRKDTVENLQNALIHLRPFLEDVMEQCNTNEKLQALRSRIVEKADKTNSVLDSYLAGDAHQSLVMRLDTIAEDINAIQAEVSEIFTKMLSAGDIMVGLDDEAQKIIELLKRGTKLLDIVSVVGMAGLGKTTLAKKVYRDPTITHHFDARSWCRVSQVYSKKSLLLEILYNFDKLNHDKLSEMDEDDLALKLYRYLKGKKYLVILDDVWDISVWNSLLNSFPTDANQSRILLTSRNHGVAQKIKPDRKPHRLRWLHDDESWTLMKKKICFEKGSSEAELALGREIARLCGGLPLTVLIVAGILAHTKADAWKEVAENLRTGKLSFIDQCKKTLNLSYSHLPQDLKPCFLYLGAYQEYVKIPVKNLLWLWTAEGLVKITAEGERMEDIAEKYVKELVGRSLVMIAEKRSTGRVKSFILHDLLRDFCKEKGKEANFLHSIYSYPLGTSVESSMSCRSRLYPKRDGLPESGLIFSRLRNLFVVSDNKKWFRCHRYNILYQVCQSEYLTVLDLRRINIGGVFPRVIELHGHLRYLALAFSTQGELLDIPSSISNLSELETFIVEGNRLRVSLPYSMWYMKNLRHLCITESAYLDLPKDNPEDGSDLGNLETVSTIAFPCGQIMEAVVKKFPKVRKLKCNLIVPAAVVNCNPLALDSMSRLESLTLSQVHREFHELHFQFPQNLTKLVLSGLCMPWTKISEIEELPKLEVLKLLNNSFTGKVWETVEGKFAELKYLKLEDLDLVSWTGTESDDNFPSLVKLVMQRCRCLKEVHPCLARIPELKMIEVSKCENAISSIMETKKKQEELTGDDQLKILIHYS